MTRPLPMAEPTPAEVVAAVESHARYCARCGTQTHDGTGRAIVSTRSIRGVQVDCGKCGSPRMVAASVDEIDREQYEIACDARLDAWLEDGRRGAMPRAPGGRR